MVSRRLESICPHFDRCGIPRLCCSRLVHRRSDWSHPPPPKTLEVQRKLGTLATAQAFRCCCRERIRRFPPIADLPRKRSDPSRPLQFPEVLAPRRRAILRHLSISLRLRRL